MRSGKAVRADIIGLMEAPPVRYATTPDDVKIAYTVTGSGRPFVFMPWPFSHRGLWWQTAFGRPIAEALAERFRLIQYDSRGQGMSTRGLPEDHSMDDYLVDLETVVDRLGLDHFVLYGAPLTAHVAVKYAVRNPGRVEALILGDVRMDHAWPASIYRDIARRDWDFFLHTIVRSFSLDAAPPEVAYWREALSRDDFLRVIEAAGASNIEPLLPKVQAPTLVLNTRRLAKDEPVHGLAEHGQRIAAAIPNSRLVLFDGFASIWYSDGSEPPAAAILIEEFVRDLPSREHDVVTPATLQANISQREIEVLRLIAAGRTNREIGDALVISEHTVIRHVSNIFTKTGAENRAAATAYGLRHGLV
jgi:pimeloyl-ACP methyl ester carboxylesterase/DNA-binding CsgD family transcriptional regulator